MILFSSTKRRRERAAAETLYATCVQASRAPALFLTFGVPDTLQGRFEMLSVHLFPVLHRLMHEPGDDPELARLISEAFVNDMDAALREMGVGDITVPKRMKVLYASFAGRISAYKTALAGGTDALAAAIARNVFPDAAEGEAPGDAARRLALYMAGAVAAVREAPLEALRDGRVPFPPAPAAVGEETMR